LGVAIGDAQDKLAIPRPALKRAAGKALDAVIQTLELEQIATLVVGLPLDSSGKETPQCEDVKNFVRRIERRAKVQVIYIDEYLSSVAAEERLTQNPSNRSRRMHKAKEDGLIDSIAASILLQQYFDSDR
jgi:putative Holliday junction resolvase